MESGELRVAALSYVYMLQCSSLQLRFSSSSGLLVPGLGFPTLSIGCQIAVLHSYTKARALFDVFAGFNRAVVVEVGRKVTVTTKACSGIGEQEESENDFEALPLCGGARVGWVSGSVEASFVGDTNTFGVVPFGVCADVGDVAHVVYRSITCDVVVITAFGEATLFVHSVEGSGGEGGSGARGGAMHNNEGDVSLFNHCFLWVILGE